MKKRQIFHLITLMGAISILPSCARTSDDVWEDTKSAGRHMQRGVRTLGGKQGDSRQIRCRNEFEGIDDESYDSEGSYQDSNYQEFNGSESNYQEFQYSSNEAQQADFIPLQDPANTEVAMADSIIPQPRETPGEPGSSIPGIQYFRDPNTIPQLAGIFRNIYFDYDSSLIKGPANLQIVHTIADYLKKHPHLFIFIEGHTDERGPQAYNLALGARRSNAVRNLLISEGVNPDNLFTISFGKERPVMLDHHEEAWSKNRRAEFKIYER